MKPALLAAALCALPALAPGQRTLLAVESEGLDALVVDARDAGLRRALDVAGERLAGLFESLDAPPPAAAALALLSDLAARPLSLSVVLDESAAPPVRGSLVVRTASAADAAELLARLDRLLAEGGLATEIGADGMRAFQAGPLGSGAFGTTEGGFTVRVGEGPIEVAELDTRDLHAGASASASIQFDPSALLSLIEGFAPPDREKQELIRLFTLMGFGTEDGALVRGSFGFDGDSMHTAVRSGRGVEGAKRVGLYVDAPLSEADLAMIPADATVAVLSKLDLSTMLTAFAGPEGLAAIDELEQELGMELPLELLAHLGTTMGGYASLSSGGGGVQSLVGFVRVDDEAALREGLAGLEAQIEQLGAAAAGGRVALRTESLAGAAAKVLAFPGLPVPIELTYGIAGGWLIGAASPQAFEAAVRQSTGELGDVRDNPRFLAALPERGRGAWQTLQFVDTPELLRDGYGWMTWASAAVSNALRAPEGEDGATARLLPGYNELAHGARASVTVSFADGEDLVSLGRADRSWVSNTAGMLGLPWTGMLAASMAGSAFTSAMLVSRAVDQQLDWGQADYVRVQLSEVKEGLDNYAIRNGGRYPDSLEELVTPDERGFTFLPYDSVPLDPWGFELQYIPSGVDDRFELFSLGADGLPGGVGEAADIHWGQ